VKSLRWRPGHRQIRANAEARQAEMGRARNLSLSDVEDATGAAARAGEACQLALLHEWMLKVGPFRSESISESVLTEGS
jgi:hypothetical protein